MTDEEIAKLDDYLQWEFNYKPYAELISERNNFNEYNVYFEAFEPLQFFEVFYEKVKFIKANKHRPAFVMNELEKCDFAPLQRKFLYAWLAKYFYSNEVRKDERHLADIYNDMQLKVCHEELIRFGSKIPLPAITVKKKKEKIVLSKTEQLLEKLLKKLNELPDEPSRLIYLKRELIQYVLDNPNIDERTNDYLAKIRQQIKNRESLLRLDKSDYEDNDSTRNGSELTLYQTALFFNYLFVDAKVNCANTDKSKIISSLTGFNKEKIRQHLSNLNKKAHSNFVAYEKDIEVICNLFKKLGLTATVEKIEKDVERLELETKDNL